MQPSTLLDRPFETPAVSFEKVREIVSDFEFQTVTAVGSILEGQGRCFPVNGTMVAVFLHNGEYFAVNDFCPHMGASLSESPVAPDGSVMCAWHAWCFSIKDGTWLDNRRSGIRTPTYPVRIHDNQIQVAVPPPETQGLHP